MADQSGRPPQTTGAVHGLPAAAGPAPARPRLRASSTRPTSCSRRCWRRTRDEWTSSAARPTPRGRAGCARSWPTTWPRGRRKLGAGKRDVGRERSLEAGRGGVVAPAGGVAGGPTSPRPASRPSATSSCCGWPRPWPQLPEDQRQAVELHHLQGLSVAEMAGVLGRSEPSVRACCARPGQSCRQLLAEEREGRPWRTARRAVRARRAARTRSLIAYLRGQARPGGRPDRRSGWRAIRSWPRSWPSSSPTRTQWTGWPGRCAGWPGGGRRSVLEGSRPYGRARRRTPPSGPTPRAFGDYELLEEIGRGRHGRGLQGPAAEPQPAGGA